MRSANLIVAAALCAGLAVPTVAAAQRSDPAGAPAASGSSAGTARPAARARSTREPTAGQLAARERQKRCGVEWKEAKSKGATGDLKWPKFWSQCNARLKGGQA